MITITRGHDEEAKTDLRLSWIAVSLAPTLVVIAVFVVALQAMLFCSHIIFLVVALVLWVTQLLPVH